MEPSELRYVEHPHLDHERASRILRAGLVGESTEPEARAVLLGLALYDEDRLFVERWCIRIGTDAPDPLLRGTASLGLTHLARRFREVSRDGRRLVREHAHDPTVTEWVFTDENLRELQWCLSFRSPAARVAYWCGHPIEYARSLQS